LRPNRVFVADLTAEPRGVGRNECGGLRSARGHKRRTVKNTLIVADADRVEASFRERLATIEAAYPGPDMQPMATAEDASDPNGTPFIASMEDPPAALIVLPGASARRRRVAAKTIRLRDKRALQVRRHANRNLTNLPVQHEQS
jgi:hypothetical protein